MLNWLWGSREVWGGDEEEPCVGVAVQLCQDMKSPIIYSILDLYLSERMSSGHIQLGGGFLDDTSRWVGCVALVVDGGIDLLVVALLCHAFFYC